MPAKSGADWKTLWGGIIGRGRAAPVGCRFGVRRSTVTGVCAPLPVFLALFRAVMALRLGEDDESLFGTTGSYSTVVLETFLVCALRFG